MHNEELYHMPLKLQMGTYLGLHIHQTTTTKFHSTSFSIKTSKNSTSEEGTLTGAWCNRRIAKN